MRVGQVICSLLVGVTMATPLAHAFTEEDALRHRQALGLFQQACLAQSPAFQNTEDLFATNGLARPEDASAYRDPVQEIYAGLVPVKAGEVYGKQCTVMLSRAALPILVIALRKTLSEMAEPQTLYETPPKEAGEPVIWEFRLPGTGIVSVTAGFGQQGIGVMGMQVADRGPEQ